MNIDDIEEKFEEFFKSDPALVQLFARLRANYLQQLQSSFEIFKSTKIADDRIDINGNYHDLSKSVHRTVRMRGSRNLELNLQKYTSIRKIESNSPVDFTFLQHIDPNILIDLWNKYHVAHYMTSIVRDTWHTANQPLPAVALGGLVLRYIKFKRTNGGQNRKLKREEKKSFEIEKSRHNNYLESLNSQLIKSVLESNAHLEAEIKDLKDQRLVEAQKAAIVRDETTLKALTERIERLENLQITTDLKADDEDPQIKLI